MVPGMIAYPHGALWDWESRTLKTDMLPPVVREDESPSVMLILFALISCYKKQAMLHRFR